MKKLCLLFATLFVLFVSHNLFAQVTSTGRVVNAATKPATTDSIFYVSVNGSDSNDGLSWGSAKRTPAAALAALDADGGTIHMGCGIITTATVTITKPVHIVGCGPGHYVADGSGSTTFAPVAGSVGIDISANHVYIENVFVSSQSATLGTDDAIYIHGVATAGVLRDVLTNNAGRYGIYITGADTTGWYFENVVAQYSRSDNWRFNAAAGVCVRCSGNNSVGGWGIYMMSTSALYSFHSAYVQANTLGGIFEDGASHTWSETWVDAGTGSLAEFGVNGNGSRMEFLRNANPTTITNNAPSAHNVVRYYGAAGIEGVTEVTMLPPKGATTPTTYTTTVGGLGNGYWAMYDQTNSKWLLAYNPAVSMWYAQQDFVMGNIPNGSLAKLRFANAAGGNTSLATGVTTGSFDVLMPAASGTVALAAAGTTQTTTCSVQFLRAISSAAAPTCAAIADADVPDTITVSNYLLLAAQYTGEFIVPIGYKSGPGLDTTTDDEDDVFINRTGATITITEIFCRSNDGTPTVNLLRNDGSAANIFTSDMTCDPTPTGTNGTDGILTSFVSGENVIADGQAVNLNVTAASTAERATMVVKYTKVIQ